jgi:hypothetical protein
MKAQNQEESPPFRKIYIITQDLDHILNTWLHKKGMRPLPQSVFDDLRERLSEDLRAVAFGNSDAGGAVSIRFQTRHRLNNLEKADNDSRFWIAMDDVYVPKSNFLVQVTRVYDKHGEHLLGRSHRPESEGDSLPIQIHRCRDAYDMFKKTTGNLRPEVVLADDGTFTGDSVLEILESLYEEAEIDVTHLCFAFQTTESLIKIRDKLRAQGRNISYSPSEVISATGLVDWVCERDFFLGVPRSGRTAGSMDDGKVVPSANPIIGYPYVCPWGPIREGANVEVGQFELSARLTSHSIELWQAVERANGGRKLKVSELPRFPGPPFSTSEIQGLDLIDYLMNVEQWVFGSEERRRRLKSPVLQFLRS